MRVIPRGEAEDLAFSTAVSVPQFQYRVFTAVCATSPSHAPATCDDTTEWQLNRANMRMPAKLQSTSPREIEVGEMASHGGGAAGRTLGETCEALLASGPWNAAHTTTRAGLVKRLNMIEEAGPGCRG